MFWQVTAANAGLSSWADLMRLIMGQAMPVEAMRFRWSAMRPGVRQFVGHRLAVRRFSRPALVTSGGGVLK